MSQQGRRMRTPARPTSARRAPASRLRMPEAVRRIMHRIMVPGRRAHFRHARTLSGTLGVTALGALLPGSGMLLAGRRVLGITVLTVVLALAGLVAYAATDRSAMLSAAVDPDALMVSAVLASVLLVGLVTVVVLTYRMVRRPRAPRAERVVEGVFVVLLCLLVATPLALVGRYALLQRDLVSSVFAEGDVASAPVEADTQVWGPDNRVNVLLLGGDGGVHRVGIRTDSVILASMDADTGNTTLFSLPRNLQNVPFPPGSALAELYPHGFDGPGDPLEWMLNAVYGQVPELHPELVDEAANPGAQAVKQAVSGALGLPVDYYVLVNLQGFQEVVDAIGGVTVNVNQPIPIGGDTDRGIPPDDYLDPGPAQHLDGFEALWFARGRYGLTDYDRMERQRCVVDALIDEVNPLTLLRRYEDLAEAGKAIVRTDIPQDLVPEFVELGLDLREGDVDSVVFQYSNRFDPNHPDYDWLQAKVQQVLAESAEPAGTPAAAPASGSGASPSPPPQATAPETTASDDASSDTAAAAAADEASDPCAYHPVG